MPILNLFGTVNAVVFDGIPWIGPSGTHNTELTWIYTIRQTVFKPNICAFQQSTVIDFTLNLCCTL
jgi:hypothetical protein